MLVEAVISVKPNISGFVPSGRSTFSGTDAIRNLVCSVLIW